ncbi:RHS repeat-associated core domain-containing protein, partial [Chitinimonas koreensis]|uniref:RHS repeat-associated core domain-containing protein n=1 Tax=Chitinimonas koreensis TaxID=356302 RepID=UPI00146FBCBA
TTLDTLDGVVDNKGFTGHEMLDGLDLVHMNGRVYDPLVARFISADPIIQAPYYSQSYNRYSYVWNNPTNLTDPSGYRADQLVEQVPERIEIAGQRLAEQRIEVVGQCLRLCQVKRGLRELARVKGTMAAGEVAGGTLAARWAAAGPAVRMGAPVLVAAAPPALGAAAACVRSIVCGVAVAVGAYFTYEILTKDDAEADAESLNSGGVEGANSEVPSNVGPGPYAGDSVPAGPSSRPTKEQQDKINEIGDRDGCHTCGTKDPGTKSGNWIGDHQDPTKLNPEGKPQRYYPQCKTCSNEQGGRIRWLPKP